MDSVKALLNLITIGVGDIQAVYNKERVAFPSLDDTYTGPREVEMKAMEATNTVVAAALQLVASLRDPAMTCTLTAGSVRSQPIAIAVFDQRDRDRCLRQLLWEARPNSTSPKFCVKQGLRFMRYHFLSLCNSANQTRRDYTFARLVRKPAPALIRSVNFSLKIWLLTISSLLSWESVGRLLRLLASRHIYKEVSPDVFANNRVSSALDSGKPSAEKFAK
jgi:hypothetical protein